MLHASLSKSASDINVTQKLNRFFAPIDVNRMRLDQVTCLRKVTLLDAVSLRAAPMGDMLQVALSSEAAHHLSWMIAGMFVVSQNDLTIANRRVVALRTLDKSRCVTWEVVH